MPTVTLCFFRRNSLVSHFLTPYTFPPLLSAFLFYPFCPFPPFHSAAETFLSSPSSLLYHSLFLALLHSLPCPYHTPLLVPSCPTRSVPPPFLRLSLCFHPIYPPFFVNVASHCSAFLNPPWYASFSLRAQLFYFSRNAYTFVPASLHSVGDAIF
ncbi:hypothetical protein BGX38DRAFT_468255 [Terfezia claveryi]|nr:hypothetical protein BGX38DRAFT_468255 [Terfezia claveryi]